MMRSVAAALGLLALAITSPADAQRPVTRGAQASRAAAVSPAEAKERAIRAELAEVLLQSQRYAEAAREYRRLVEVDSANYQYRLGLAQSLAWGGEYRDAERQLRLLAGARPRDASVDTLLRSVRQSMRPRAGEAAVWVREQPRYIPYRVSLARALARERRYPAALAQYDTLMALAPGTALLRETAATYRAANDLPGGLALLRNAVTRTPSDTAVRRAYAALLAEGRRLDAALAQIDTVLFAGRSASGLVERAQINVARQDLDAAAADLHGSIVIQPTAEAHLLLGDIHRWRGEYSTAHASYDRARSLAPSSGDVTARFAQLARDERPAVRFGTPIDVQPGWRTNASHVSDNVGTQYSTLSAHRGFSAPLGLLGSAGVEVRHLRERLPGEEPSTTGYAADVALSRSVIHRAFRGDLSALGGIVHHPRAGSRPFGAVGLTAYYNAWAASAEVSAGPAYPSLMTTAFLTSSDDDAPWLTERTVTASLAGPVGAVDAGLSVRQSEFNDGNRRVAVQAFGRYPLSPRLSAIYQGNTVGFAYRSPLYWDPSSYVASSLGLQVAERRLRGLSYALSVLPGVAYAEDTPYLRQTPTELDDARLRPQIAATGEIAYRGDGWEAAVSYGWGRLGSYERNDARIGLRFVP